MKCIVYFDGACEPKNPGGVGTYGYVIYIDNIKIREDYGIVCEPNPDCTNNVAEYTALIKALEWLVSNDYSEMCSELIIHGDSQLVIKQIEGKYSVKSSRILPLYEKVLELLSKFHHVIPAWIRRDVNVEADKLSKRAYEEYMDNHPELVEKFRKYLATPKQIELLKAFKIEHHRYISRFEASRILHKILKRIRR